MHSQHAFFCLLRHCTPISSSISANLNTMLAFLLGASSCHDAAASAKMLTSSASAGFAHMTPDLAPMMRAFGLAFPPQSGYPAFQARGFPQPRNPPVPIPHPRQAPRPQRPTLYVEHTPRQEQMNTRVRCQVGDGKRTSPKGCAGSACALPSAANLSGCVSAWSLQIIKPADSLISGQISVVIPVVF